MAPAAATKAAVTPLRVVPPVPTEKPAKRDFLTPKELLARWKGVVKPQTLTNWRNPKINKGPAFHQIGGRILYDLEDIKAFEAGGRTVPTNEDVKP